MSCVVSSSLCLQTHKQIKLSLAQLLPTMLLMSNGMVTGLWQMMAKHRHALMSRPFPTSFAWRGYSRGANFCQQLTRRYQICGRQLPLPLQTIH